MARKPHTDKQVRPLGGYLNAGPWAIDRRYALQAQLERLATDNEAGLLLSMSEDDVVRAALKETNGFTTYVNPDKTEVSSLDMDASDRIQPGAVAIIPIHGVMLKSCPNWWQHYGFTSTARATRDVALAAEDERVARIIINAYTPGGMVYGADQLNATIQRAKEMKPVDAYVSDLCASAGVFAIAHATSINLSSRTAEIGSIGTMTTVINDEKYWEEWGIQFIDVYASDSTDKNAAYTEAADGKPKKLVAELDKFNAVFTSTVTDGRAGKLSKKEDVLTGKMYMGEEAIRVGLADAFATLDDMLASTAQEVDTSDTVPDPDTNTNAQQHPKTMSKLSLLSAFTAALAGIFANKEEPTQQEMANANNALTTEGFKRMKLVTDKEAEGLADVQALQARAEQLQNQLTAVTTERDNLQATNATQATDLANATGTLQKLSTGLKAIAEKHKLEAKEGQSLEEAVVEAAATWAEGDGAKHTAGASGTDNKKELTGSLKAAAAAGIPVGEAKA